MIILDTNVISETFPKVMHWIGGLRANQVALAAPSVAEFFFGVEIIPEGRKRALWQRQLDEFLKDVLVITFDLEAAQAYAVIVSNRRKLGMPIGTIDGQIASIAAVHSAAVAIRNVPDFTHCGVVEIINPWEI